MKTLALIIGNNEYLGKFKLDNPINDATGIKQVFERLGYDIIFCTNGNSQNIVDLLSEFENRLNNYDASIFYFAGHGFEIDGENYLAFKDCQLDHANRYHCNLTCIQLTDLLGIYKKYSNKINIAIIDACRKSFERSGVIATSPIHAPRGTLIAFSTSPNEGASDVGFEGNSLYTGALLKYIGRERLSVEELFKKVRKTVFNISGGKQTSWENTSLIGDYYFNTGQLVYSLSILYSEDVVKDINYINADKFGQIIKQIKSYDWNIQNPAIERALIIPANSLDKNQQFIFGRNLLQSSGAAYVAQDFMKSIENNLRKYQTKENENHVLDGILFEIYFNSQGEFRKNKTKKYYFEEIISLRKNKLFFKSFEFISQLLQSNHYPLIYIPKEIDEIFDIDVVANNQIITNTLCIDTEFQIISKITCNSINIIREISNYNIYGKNASELKFILSDFLSIPLELIQINSNIKLNKIGIAKALNENDLLKW